MSTGINYLDEVWSVVTGCTPVHAGCDNCWARGLHDMRHRAHKAGKHVPAQYAQPFNKVQLFPDRLEQPLRWRKPKRIGVSFMGDLYHADVPDEFIDRVMAVAALCPQHRFVLPTKRPERAAKYWTTDRLINWWPLGTKMEPVCEHISVRMNGFHGVYGNTYPLSVPMETGDALPLKNLIHLASVCDQATADAMIPHLLNIPGKVGLSIEPMIGAIDLSRSFPCGYYCDERNDHIDHPFLTRQGQTSGKHLLHWSIIGAESGKGRRPMSVEWARAIVAQCRAAGVPVFVKQLDINGRVETDLAKFPSDLRVREFPEGF